MRDQDLTLVIFDFKKQNKNPHKYHCIVKIKIFRGTNTINFIVVENFKYFKVPILNFLYDCKMRMIDPNFLENLNLFFKEWTIIELSNIVSGL